MKKHLVKAGLVVLLSVMVLLPGKAFAYSLFLDGFESGNFSARGWLNNGARVELTYKYTGGTHTAELNRTDELIKALSTSRCSDITLSYARYAERRESSDHLWVEWYDGDTWYNIEDVTGNFDWTEVSFTLPSGASNNSDFQFRFRVSQGYSNYVYIDDVKVKGTLSEPASSEIIISINESQIYQTMDGFGASLTDSSAWLIWNALTFEERQALLEELFDARAGIGLSYIRLPMGSCDYTAIGVKDYTYDDMPEEETDYGLEYFSISHDESYIIPILQQILQINPGVKIMAVPCSAPVWMKTSEDLTYGRLIDNDAIYNTYADYFVKFIQAYAAEGITINAVSLQNEPHYEPKGKYPGMWMDEKDQARLVKVMGPKFEEAGIEAEIVIWDHNWDEYDYPITVLDDEDAKPYIAGSAFHCYRGQVLSQSLVKEAHPDKNIYFTECSAGGWSTDFGNNLIWSFQNLLIGSTRNWAQTVLEWNLALDNYGPNNPPVGCTNCVGIIDIDQDTGQVTKSSEYYAYGHLSKFVPGGATRIDSTGKQSDIENVAFKNPDGSLVAVVLNSGYSARHVNIVWREESFTYTLPYRSVVTFTWPEESGATVSVWLTTGDQVHKLEQQDDLQFS